jgi:hypothetical protein
MKPSLARCVHRDFCKPERYPTGQRAVVTLGLGFALALAVFSAPRAQAQTFGVLYNFTGGVDGKEPYATLVRDKAGNLYGTTYAGGGFRRGDSVQGGPGWRGDRTAQF